MTETTDQTASQASPQLQLQDILVAAQAIELASARGAFRADELSRVGGAYDRVVAFLRASGAVQNAAPADSATQGN